MLHLISSSGLYGAERVLIELMRCNSDLHGGEYTFNLGLIETGKEEGFIRELEADRIPYTVFSCASRLDIACIKAIRRFMETERVSIVHSHGYKSDLFAYMASGRNLHKVATNHLWGTLTPLVRLYYLIDALVLRRYDSVIAVSHEIALEMERRGVARSNINVIENGIRKDVPRKEPSTDLATLRASYDVIFTTIARLAPEKGHEILLDAFRHFMANRLDLKACLLIVGDGPLRTKLDGLAREINRSERGSVQLLGFRDDIPQILEITDLFVLPSMNEGSPICLIEAMRAGKPIIATDVGGVGKMIRNNVDGVVVEKGSPKEIQDQLNLLSRDGELRQRFSQNARQRFLSTYSSEIMYRKYCEIYDRYRSGPPV